MKLQKENTVQGLREVLSQRFSESAASAFARTAVVFAVGFFLSAARLCDAAIPLALAVLCVGLPGWTAMAFAVGAALGYGAFWGYAASEGLVWIAVGLAVGQLLDKRKKALPLLLPGLSALTVAVSGLIFQKWQALSVGVYLLRVVTAFGATCLVQTAWRRRVQSVDAALAALFVLALAQVDILRICNLGILAAAFLALTGDVPMATLSGLALDLTGVAPVPMAAVMCTVALLGKIERLSKRVKRFVPSALYLLVMWLCARRDFAPLPPLLLGGMGSLLLPTKKAQPTLRDDVRTHLEQLSGVFAQSRQMLRDTPICAPDEGALIRRAAQRACESCQRRDVCDFASRAPLLPQTILHQHSITPDDVPAACAEPERLSLRLQQSQDHYRLLQADRQRRKEYREAILQQYGFLSEYLRTAADAPAPQMQKEAFFRAETAVCTRGREAVNGDRVMRFAVENRYFVVLCDGMGTGAAAAYEARTAGAMLRRMLTAGYSAPAAMHSVNSLCILRESAGAVTMDVAEADLIGGRVTLYKWGAAPSWRLGRTQWERIGRECLPPGVSVTECGETVDRVDLSDGAVLLMLSDGVDGERAAESLNGQCDQPIGFLAALSLENGAADEPDDATAIALRLQSLS